MQEIETLYTTLCYFLIFTICFLFSIPSQGQIENVPYGAPQEISSSIRGQVSGISLAPVTLEKDNPWNYSGEFTFNFQQVALDNWASGGESSLSFGGISNVGIVYRDIKNSWETNLEIAYGVNRRGGKPNRFIKNDDNILLNSTYKGISNNLNLTTILDFRTQLAQGFNYVETGPNNETIDAVLISRFMSPAYLKTHVGVSFSPDWGNYENNNFTIALSPFAGKFTIVADDELADQDLFGVGAGKNIRAEGGSNLSIALKQQIAENIRIKSNLDLFSNINTFQNVDVNFQSRFFLKVNDYIKSSISSQLIYDDDIKITRDDGTVGPSIQFKNVINVGFSFSF